MDRQIGQQAKGKERVRHITNLQAGLSGTGVGSSPERRAAGERTRADVTHLGGWCPLLPSSSLLSSTALSHASCPGVLLASPGGPCCLGGRCGGCGEARGDPTSNGGGEAAANTNSAGSCQHFNVSCLIL